MMGGQQNQQMMQPGMGAMGMQQQPMMEQQQQQQQVAQAKPAEESNTGGFKVEASSFNITAGEFVPVGKVALTEEQFPTFGDDMGGGSNTGKKKRKDKKKPQVQQQEDVKKEEEDNAWKGKPSSFFEMTQGAQPSNDPQNPNNFELNPDQWNFMF